MFYVIANFVGLQVNRVSFLDWETLREMAARDGHEIGSHSLTHREAGLGYSQKVGRLFNLMRNDGLRRSTRHLFYSFTSRPEGGSPVHHNHEDEIRLSKLKIENELSSQCVSYSYPGGGYNSRLKDMVRSAGYRSARTGYAGYNVWQEIDLYALRVKTWDNATTSAEAKAWVDAAIERRLWLIEVFHTIGAGEYLYTCHDKELMEHLAYIRERTREIEVLTAREVV